MIYAKFYSRFDDLETIVIIPVLFFDKKGGYVQMGVGPDVMLIGSEGAKEQYGRFMGYISEIVLSHEIERLKEWATENRKFTIY